MKKTIPFILIWMIGQSLDLQGQGFAPQPNEPIQSLENDLLVAEDAKDSTNIEQVINGELAFKPIHANKKLDIRKIWWLKIDLNPDFSSDQYYIGLTRSNLSGLSQGNDIADIWITSSGKDLKSYKAGNLEPTSVRPIDDPINRNFFPVSLKQDQPLTVYIRIGRSVNFEPLQVNFALHHKSIIASSSTGIERLALFYTGVMLILFLFGLIFFIITREKPFIWFTAMAAMYGLHMLVLHPENPLTKWLFPERPIYQYHFFTILTAGGVVIQLQFVRSFARLKHILPKWDKVVLAIMGAMGLLGIISLLIMELSHTGNVPELLSLLLFVAMIVVTFRLITIKDIYGRITGVAMLWLFVFQTLGILWNNAIIPAWFPNPWPIAQIGMMVILFFALAYRFRHSAKEKAEAAKVLEMDMIKSRFFANISHEFRTPLTLMLGPLRQMEENSMDPAQQKKYTRIMRRNGERLLQLINQLLDLSKLESGKMDLTVAKTDLTGLLKSISSSFDSLAEEKQINYHLHFPEENMMGYIDRDKLEKIVVNLLSNAFRFTAANGSVSFSAEKDEKRLRFTVQDNGVGMPKEQLNKIFDRFHQVSGTEGGTGIGLALAKELLQLHKGQISVQSETGKGSSFRVSIPIAAEFYSASEMGSRVMTGSLSPGENGKEPFIEEGILENDPALPLVLVVEDNNDLQQYIGDTLRNHFQVQVAGNGKIGLQKAIELVPDCIVSDVMMPEMDGIEMCKRIKKESATNHIPVIMLTAKAGSGSRIEGLQTGADDYIVKPFDGPELIIRIQNLVEQRKQLRERWSKQVISVQPEKIIAPSAEQEFILSVRASIEENIDNELFGVAELANAIHLSRSQLHRKLKALTGQAPNELIRNYRLERALQLLEQQAGTITEITYQTGFSSPAYFSKCFSDRYGFTPKDTPQYPPSPHPPNPPKGGN